MGYGFANAPSHFSRVIHQAIQHIKNIFNYLGISNGNYIDILFFPYIFFIPSSLRRKRINIGNVKSTRPPDFSQLAVRDYKICVLFSPFFLTSLLRQGHEKMSNMRTHQTGPPCFSIFFLPSSLRRGRIKIGKYKLCPSNKS